MKCMRCNSKYKILDNKASVLRCCTYLAKNDHYAIVNGLQLCPECTKAFLIWFGDGLKTKEDQNV